MTRTISEDEFLRVAGLVGEAVYSLSAELPDATFNQSEWMKREVTNE